MSLVPSLFYRLNNRHEEAVKSAPENVRYVSSRWFNPSELEWFKAKFGSQNVPFEKVYVFAHDPNAEAIQAAYTAVDVPVEVIGAKAEAAPKPKPKPKPATPKPRAKKKAVKRGAKKKTTKRPTKKKAKKKATARKRKR